MLGLPLLLRRALRLQLLVQGGEHEAVQSLRAGQRQKQAGSSRPDEVRDMRPCRACGRATGSSRQAVADLMKWGA